MEKLCKCGCGQPVRLEKNMYIFGHHNNDISNATREKIRLWHLGMKYSEEAKRNMSLAQKGEKHWNFGRHLSEETKQKIKKKRKTQIITEETRRKISEAHRGRHQSQETINRRTEKLRGKKRSLEIRRKMSLATSGENNSQYGKHISEETRIKKRKTALQKNLGKTFPSWKGKKRPPFSKEHIERIRQRRLIQKHCYTTSIELIIRNFLKELNIEYIPHKDILGLYQCDIFIPYYNLVIECDGNYWHKYPFGTERDKLRTESMINNGYKVLRLWESDIRQMSIETFKEKLGVINGEMV